jgi:hypothetical protein
MEKRTLRLTEKEIQQIEAILLDRDREEALRFLEEVIAPQLEAGEEGESDLSPSRR